MKGKILLCSSLVLLIVIGGEYGWFGTRNKPQPPPADIAVRPAADAQKTAPSARADMNMPGAVDIQRFALNDVLAHWKTRVRPPAENPDEALIFESVRKAPIPSDAVKNLLNRYAEKNNPSLQESLEIVSALGFCERRQAYVQVPDATARQKQPQEEYATYCAELENIDYLASKNIMRGLVDAGYMEAKLMYHAVGPLGRQAAEEEIVEVLGEDATRQWLNESAQYLIDYARNGGSRPDMAYSALAAMHGGFAQKPPAGSLFAERFDAEKAYTYEYLRVAALIASPPPMARPEMLTRIQENSLQNLRRMESALAPEQISAARQRASDILAGS